MSSQQTNTTPISPPGKANTTRTAVSDAERIMALFAGDRANKCRPEMGAPESDGKVYPVEVDRWSGPPTLDLFEEHLAGDIVLGVYPEQKSGMCAWGGLDSDDYQIDHAELARRAEKE